MPVRRSQPSRHRCRAGIVNPQVAAVRRHLPVLPTASANSAPVELVRVRWKTAAGVQQGPGRWRVHPETPFGRAGNSGCADGDQGVPDQREPGKRTEFVKGGAGEQQGGQRGGMRRVGGVSPETSDDSIGDRDGGQARTDHVRQVVLAYPFDITISMNTSVSQSVPSVPLPRSPTPRYRTQTWEFRLWMP